MSFSPVEIEVLFQLAMAIGTAPELGSMLRNSLSTTMRKLDCSTGSVWRHQQGAGQEPLLTLEFSIPRNILAADDYLQLVRVLQQQLQQDGEAAFRRRLPLTLPLGADQQVYVFDLPDFGLLLLGKFGASLPEHILRSLPPLNEKLAQACRFCLQNELVRRTNFELQAEGARRLAAQDELRATQAQLEQRVEERTAELHRANEELQQEIGERQRAESALRASEATYRTIFEHAGAGLNIISPDGIILKVNPAFSRMIGYSAEELEGKRVVGITHPDSIERTNQLYQEVQAGLRTDFSYEKQFMRKNGSVMWGLVTCAWLFDPQGRPLHGVSLVQDITERKRTEAALRRNEARLNYLAYHDPLTNLPNRTLFHDRLQHAMAAARRNGQPAALLFLDLDRFKNVNDSLGHAVGDRLLVKVADRLRGCVRVVDTLARLGGDEFVVIVEQLHSPQDAARVARQILRTLAEPVDLDARELYLTTSIGISLFPSDGDTVEELMKAADVAMYRSKDQGRNCFQFYTPDMDGRISELLALENDLRKGLEQGQLEVHYQPQLDLTSGRVIGLEALLRWHHPQRGQIPPTQFIPLAEETGLIVPIGAWVLHTACRQAQAWHLIGLPPVGVAVNISTRQFRQADFIDEVERALADSGLPPDRLELEITESVIMHDVEAAILTLTDLKTRGIRLVVDDFGTGYSSLNYLKRFPIDSLKIDRSFVRDVITDPNDAAIASAVIALAQSMNLRVVAEGIETREQLRFLQQRGCGEGQGFLFSPAVPAAQVPEVLGRRFSVTSPAN